ncbi:translation initiation factor IF-2 subunit gamma [Candidatus Woesearchaeota archaeon]|nr:translation initiation factor IF-2 subunit gamma [Candidatus Woesearchaeota archaeon]
MARKKKDEQQQEPPKAGGQSSQLPEQPVLNIGMVGHVDHGKTTLLERLSGKWTDTHSEELKRGITIRLGYADVTFRKCDKCEGAKAYTIREKCPVCSSDAKPLRKVSFVDAPGHESLMATMLSGATIMDGALLLVAANEQCPQPQTREHLMALQIIGVKHVIVVQNKIDLASEEQAIKNYEQVKGFLKGTVFENAPVIPISAQHRVGLDFLMQAIDEHIPTPARDKNKEPIMLVARSFDINKPGISPDKLVGGVLGGSLKQGILKVDDTIEIRPGRAVIEKNQQVWKPITTKIISLNSGGSDLVEVGPSGSIGVLTSLDPSIVKSDQLTGSVVGLPGKLPKVWTELILDVHLLNRVVGTKEELNVEPVKMSEPLMLNVNSAATAGIVIELRKNKIRCKLKRPVCADAGSRVTISRRIGRFRLIGYGEIV